MSTGNPQFNPKHSSPNASEEMKSLQEVQWEQKRQKIDEIVDEFGARIDEGIKDTIVALNLHGITTVASCEGHAEFRDDQHPWPWLVVQAPNEPEERFMGEMQEWEKSNHKLHIAVSQLLDEFYLNRKVDKDIRLKAKEQIYPFHGVFDIDSITDKDEELKFLNKELTDEENKKLVELLPVRQKEMQDFADFLKAKFLAQTE